MAKTTEIKIPDDIEYRVIGNAFCLVIAFTGLLAGQMMQMRSTDYWLDDIVPLVLICWLGFRLYRNSLTMMIAYRDVPLENMMPRQANPIRGEAAIAGHLTANPNQQFSAENVIAQVTKRIEAQKAGASKSNKFTN